MYFEEKDNWQLIDLLAKIVHMDTCDMSIKCNDTTIRIKSDEHIDIWHLDFLRKLINSENIENKNSLKIVVSVESDAFNDKILNCLYNLSFVKGNTFHRLIYKIEKVNKMNSVYFNTALFNYLKNNKIIDEAYEFAIEINQKQIDFNNFMLSMFKNKEN